MRCLKIFFLSSCCLRLIIVLCVHYRRLLEINFYKNKKQSYLNSFIFVESSVVEKFCNQRKGGQDKFFFYFLFWVLWQCTVILWIIFVIFFYSAYSSYCKIPLNSKLKKICRQFNFFRYLSTIFSAERHTDCGGAAKLDQNSPDVYCIRPSGHSWVKNS